MLAELKRCNSVGSLDGLFFLVSIISGKQQVSNSEIANRCSLENSITLNCSGAVAFLQYLGYVENDGVIVTPNSKFTNLIGKNKDEVISEFVRESICVLTSDGIFDEGETTFDAEKGHLCIKRSAFPLAYAAIRNFLTTAGALEKEQNGEIGINESYESDFSSLLRGRKEKFTLEQLMQKQEEQSRRGLEAEEFVLQYERNRIPTKAYKIKRISDFDVSAGYDIVSFKSMDSVGYDKLIEVKCYIGNPHFYWSENETDVAKRKGDKYVLCLVDYNKMKEPGYDPMFISNPSETIFEDSSWLVNTASYKIQKI